MCPLLRLLERLGLHCISYLDHIQFLRTRMGRCRYIGHEAECHSRHYDGVDVGVVVLIGVMASAVLQPWLIYPTDQFLYLDSTSPLDLRRPAYARCTTPSHPHVSSKPVMINKRGNYLGDKEYCGANMKL